MILYSGVTVPYCTVESRYDTVQWSHGTILYSGVTVRFDIKMTYVVQIQKKKNLFMGEGILLRASSLLSVYSPRFSKDEYKKGACLREMPQESWEIFDFRLGNLPFEDSGTHHYCDRIF